MSLQLNRYHQQIYETLRNSTQQRIKQQQTQKILHSQLLNHYENQLVRNAVDQRRLQFRDFVAQKARQQKISREIEQQGFHKQCLGKIDALKKQRLKLMIQKNSNKENIVQSVIANTRRRKYSCDHALEAIDDQNISKESFKQKADKIMQGKCKQNNIEAKTFNFQINQLQNMKQNRQKQPKSKSSITQQKFFMKAKPIKQNLSKQQQIVRYTPQYYFNQKLAEKIKNRWLNDDKNTNTQIPVQIFEKNDIKSYPYPQSIRNKNQPRSPPNTTNILDSRLHYLQNYEQMGSNFNNTSALGDTNYLDLPTQISNQNTNRKQEQGKKRTKSILKNNSNRKSQNLDDNDSKNMSKSINISDMRVQDELQVDRRKKRNKSVKIVEGNKSHRQDNYHNRNRSTIDDKTRNKNANFIHHKRNSSNNASFNNSVLDMSSTQPTKNRKNRKETKKSKNKNSELSSIYRTLDPKQSQSQSHPSSQKYIPFSQNQGHHKNRSAVQKIQKRIQFSNVTYSDSSYRNILHEKVHLANTYANQRMMRNQLKDKICTEAQMKRKDKQNQFYNRRYSISKN